MNKIYKLVWNNVRGCYVVASEFAKAHGRSARRAVVGAFVAAAMVSGMGVAEATIPEGTIRGDNAIAIGEGSSSDGDNAIAVGKGSRSDGDNAIAIGDLSVTEGEAAISLGYLAKAYGKRNVAVGNGAAVGSHFSQVIESLAFGVATGVYSSKSVAIGLEAKVKENSEGSVAIGNNAIASHANSVALGAGSQTVRNNSIAVGNRQITGLAEGTAATDAVNVGQLNQLRSDIMAGEFITKFDDVRTGDAFIASSYTATESGQQKTYFKLDINPNGNIQFTPDTADRTVTMSGNGYSIIDGGKDKQVYLDEDGLELYSDNEKNVVKVTSTGIAMGDSKITGVAAGTDDTDAVNVKQMKDANAETLKKANDYTDTQIDATTKQLEHKINNTNDRVDRVGATAAALAAINYQPMAKGQSQVAVGMGGYKGKKATAIGMAYQFSDRVSGSVAGSASADEHMFNVGFNYVFGQHRNKDIVQCAVTPGSMSLKEAEMQSTIDSQGAKINDMEARIAQLEAMVKVLAAK